MPTTLELSLCVSPAWCARLVAAPPWPRRQEVWASTNTLGNLVDAAGFVRSEVEISNSGRSTPPAPRGRFPNFFHLCSTFALPRRPRSNEKTILVHPRVVEQRSSPSCSQPFPKTRSRRPNQADTLSLERWASQSFPSLSLSFFYLFPITLLCSTQYLPVFFHPAHAPTPPAAHKAENVRRHVMHAGCR